MKSQSMLHESSGVRILGPLGKTRRKEGSMRKVSIICPTFNHETFIATCVDSVLQQSYTDWELIVIDDGSSDRTWEIVCQYSERDDRIRPYRMEHHGLQRLGEIYNFGLAHCKGRYVAVLEGDDFWPAEKLEKQIANHGSSLMSYGDCLLAIDETNTYRAVARPPFSGAIHAVDFLRIVLLHQSNAIAVTQMYALRALEKIGGFQQAGSPGAVDFATLLSVSQLDGTFTYIQHPLGYWRQHAGQTTQSRGVALAEFNADLAARCFERLSPDIRNCLAISLQNIRDSRKSSLADVYLIMLRQAMRSNDSDTIVRAARQLWSNGQSWRKTQAVCGILASQLGFKAEPTEFLGRMLTRAATRR